MIKYIVISGGDITFLSMLGAVKMLVSDNFIDLTNIETIYGVSCGSWIGLFMQLNIDFETIKNYFVERPWEKLLEVGGPDILNLYNSIGLFNNNIFYEMFKPLLKMCNLNVNITMIELYEYSKIEFNVYATKFADLSLTCFNHINTPNVKVIDAIFMSSTIPIICRPMIYENNYYIDGCYSCNYPMSLCLEKHKNISEIFGINAISNDDDNSLNQNNNENFLSFYIKVFYKLIINKQNTYHSNIKTNTLNIVGEYISITKFIKVVTNGVARNDMINSGEDIAVKFIESTIESPIESTIESPQ